MVNRRNRINHWIYFFSLIGIIAIAIFLAGCSNKIVSQSEVVNITDGAIDIPNTNKTCTNPIINDSDLYCNIDDVEDR